MQSKLLRYSLIALLEGFTTLAVEIIAIRLAVPIVGSSIILTGIVLSVILLALSTGYWMGGIKSAKVQPEKLPSLLARNFLIAAVLYGCVSLPFFPFSLQAALAITKNLVVSIIIVSMVLLFLPVYFASQTLPILTECCAKDKSPGEIAGRILFFSTVGSVLGGTVTPVILFETIGVKGSIWCVVAILFACLLLLPKTENINFKAKTAVSIFLLTIFGYLQNYLALPNGYYFKFNKGLNLIYSTDTPYHNINIFNSTNGSRLMQMNGGAASGIEQASKEPHFIYCKELLKSLELFKPEKILVIGSAGFVLPYWVAKSDYSKHIVAIDIDKAVHELTEKYFFQESLPAKIEFLPVSARFYINEQIKAGNKFDLVFADAYSGRFGVPSELNTLEFFQSLGKLSDKVILNLILDRELQSNYSINTISTLTTGLNKIWHKRVDNLDNTGRNNFIVSNFDTGIGSTQWSRQGKFKVYTDDLNSIEYDRLDLELKL